MFIQLYEALLDSPFLGDVTWSFRKQIHLHVSFIALEAPRKKKQYCILKLNILWHKYFFNLYLYSSGKIQVLYDYLHAKMIVRYPP